MIMVSGGVAGVVSRTATAPFDRLKTLMQAERPGCTKNKTIKGGLTNIYRKGGWQAFFRGNGTNVVKIAPESAMKFYFFARFKRMLVDANPDDDANAAAAAGGAAGDPLHVWELFVAGAMSGMCSQTLIYPMEIVKTRLAVSDPGTYTGVWDCLAKISREEGAKAIFRGLVPSICGVIPYSSVEMGMFFSLRDWYALKHPEKDLSAFVLVGFGSVSSFCGQIVAYPLQLTRTKLQSMGLHGRPMYRGMTHVLTDTFQRAGVAGLYRGILPNFVKSIPAISLSYVVYENVLGVLRQVSRSAGGRGGTLIC
jgi:solute carrier family 25 phosphate transporter 23/24/25/41